MSTVDTLRRARALIEDPAHHTTVFKARNRRGQDVDPRSRGAVRWCAIGAIEACSDDPREISMARVALRVEMPMEYGANGVAWYNDTFGHAPTLALFDKAIAAEEEDA